MREPATGRGRVCGLRVGEMVGGIGLDFWDWEGVRRPGSLVLILLVIAEVAAGVDTIEKMEEEVAEGAHPLHLNKLPFNQR